MRSSPKNIFIFFVVCIFTIAPVFVTVALEARKGTQDLRSMFEQANRLYDQGKFDKAREIYEEIIKGGINDPAVFYNAGNACARGGDTGMAVFYYYKALRLAPRDRDIRENLARLEPAINHSNAFFLLKPFIWLKNLLSLDAWTVLCSLFLFLACLSLGLYFLTRRYSLMAYCKRAFPLFLVFLLMAGIFLGFRFYSEVVIKTAIVMKADALARSGPGDQFEELYKLPAGTKVRIISNPQNSWVRIRLMDGRSAYLPLTEIRGVN
ncbi:SH3 domain-containing protein [Candidatus Sumerlaeota bacterium]|nr:SH3 domain-containing protein [Candidatus Sumerlaeota bacterium]